ncbi:MAG: 6-phosphogluconolactonase, partial [Desulfocapsaceae bacterium]|nr:6-phosphogluconolactonase [Desulfocapsaceae bacterium]
ALIREHLGTKVPSGMLHRFTPVPDTHDHGIAAYNSELQRCGGRFDIVLASSGEDGHIASLFPGHPCLQDNTDGYVLVSNAPKPPPGRMSAGVQLIRGGDTGILLFFGSSKRAALHGFLDKQRPSSECPAKIMAALPTLYLLTDQEIDTP